LVFSLFDENDEVWIDVKRKSNSSSFIFIHGCNAGLKFAPLLSKKTGIAVFAALTSTDFEYIYKNTFWSADDKPDIGKKSAENIMNYKNPKLCGNYCTRMSLIIFHIEVIGETGQLAGTLLINCFAGPNENSKCESGALEGVLTFPGVMSYAQAKTNLTNFKKAINRFYVPICL